VVAILSVTFGVLNVGQTDYAVGEASEVVAMVNRFHGRSRFYFRILVRLGSGKRLARKVVSR
jgi:hypothetical protein